MREEDETNNWKNSRGDVPRQGTKDHLNIFVLLIVYFIFHWRMYKSVIEASYILSATRPLFYRTNFVLSFVLLNRWNEMQENRRRYQRTLHRPGLAPNSLILFCVLYMSFPVILKCVFIYFIDKLNIILGLVSEKKTT
jgi:hypothetical protein